MKIMALLSLSLVAFGAPPSALTAEEREALHVAQKRVLFAQLAAERAAAAAKQAQDEAAGVAKAYMELEAKARKKMGKAEDEQMDEALNWVKKAAK